MQSLPTETGKKYFISNNQISKINFFELKTLIFFTGNLKQLGVLSLRDNKLQYLPIEVGQCTALHVLDVSGNRYIIFLF